MDWEIKGTLDKQDGLIAVKVPTNPRFIVPNRLYDNTQSGDALWTTWELVKANPPLLARPSNPPSEAGSLDARCQRQQH